MEKNIFSLSAYESYKFIEKELLGLSDITLVILKGHIVTEYYLNAVILNIVDFNKTYSERSFTYMQKLEIARMTCIDKQTYNELKLLNKLRNGIAHSLEYDQISVNNFVNIMGDAVKEKFGEIATFKSAVAYLCGKLQGSIQGHFKVMKSLIKDNNL